MTKHAKLSASGSAIWLNCPGSVKAQEGFSNTSSDAAQEGTCAHALADIVLSENAIATDFIGKKIDCDDCDCEITEEMANHIQEYVNRIRGLQCEYMFFEERVDFSDWVPDGFGTSDFIGVKDDNVYIVDLKYGKGKVDAHKNSQLMLYALGAYAQFEYLYDLKKVVMIIDQPRIDHYDEFEISISELLKFGASVAQQCEVIESDNPPRIPGEKQCQWCRAKHSCAELQRHTEKIMMVEFSEFDDIDAPQPETLTSNQVRTVLENKRLIEGWLKAVEDNVTRKLNSGEDFPGFKMVAGRSMRKWPEGAPTLAPESDPRPAINTTANDFDCLDFEVKNIYAHLK